MIKKMTAVATFFLLALLSNNTSAQSKFYVFGTIGESNSDATLGSINRVDDSDSSYSVGAGYTFTPNFSLEASYIDFGSHDGETDCPPGFTCLVIPVSTQAELTGVSFSLIGSIPLTDKLDAYGKVGFVSWDVDFSGISTAFDASGEDMLYGAGLRGSINDHWKVFAEYQKVELDLDSANIGVSYYF